MFLCMLTQVFRNPHVLPRPENTILQVMSCLTFDKTWIQICTKNDDVTSPQDFHKTHVIFYKTHVIMLLGNAMFTSGHDVT